MLFNLIILILLLFVLIIYYKQYYDYFNLYYWNDSKLDDQNKIINTFNTYGCTIIQDILTKNDCDALLKLINIKELQINNEYGDIMSSYNRKDLIIPLEDTQPYITKICEKLN